MIAGGEEALASLQSLFESEAMADAYGEDISIRAHMLQCAELAVEQGLSEQDGGDALVAAALLHDIGWGMAGQSGEDGADGHEHTAADLLAPLFGPAVAEPVRAHVAAKRYLVTARPGYGERLSECSRETLARQGGPFTAEECAAFEARESFRAAVALRYLDDAGKALSEPESRFGDYLPVLRRLLRGWQGL